MQERRFREALPGALAMSMAVVRGIVRRALVVVRRSIVVSTIITLHVNGWLYRKYPQITVRVTFNSSRAEPRQDQVLVWFAEIAVQLRALC